MKLKSIHVLIAIAIVILAAGAAVWVFVEPPAKEKCECPTSELLRGSLFVSDAGSPTGNFTKAGTYNVSLSTNNGTGFLILTFDSGTDVITERTYAITCLCSVDNGFEVKFDGQRMELPLDLVDPVWNGTYANHYIASYGQHAPPEAKRGSIDPLSFPGLHWGYYVELRLK